MQCVQVLRWLQSNPQLIVFIRNQESSRCILGDSIDTGRETMWNTLLRSRRQRNGLLLLPSIVLGLSVATNANAIPITFDPVNFVGRYQVFGVTPRMDGVQIIDLDPGNHEIRVADNSPIPITVDASGNVTTTNSGAVIGGFQTVTFNNIGITIDPGQFEQNNSDRWGLRFVEEFNTGASTIGPQNIVVVPNLSYWVSLGGSQSFVADIDSLGNVTVQNGISGVGGLQSLSFNTQSVTVDPSDFDQNSTGDWGVRFIHKTRSSNTPGPQTVYLVPGVDNYSFDLGQVSSFLISVDGAGNAAAMNGVSATGGFGSLTLNTVPVSIDPGNFDQNSTGDWGIRFIHNVRSSSSPGPQTVYLVPGVTNYGFTIGQVLSFTVGLDTSNNMSVANGISGVGGFQSLTLNTELINVNPGTFSGNWSARFVHTASGEGTFFAVPGANYSIRAGSDNQTVGVGLPCSATPSNFPLDGTTFDLSCPPGTISLTATGDSFLRQGAKDRNEGANPMLRIRKSGKNRSVVKFDEQSISGFGAITKATLRLHVRDTGNNWGSGRTVDAHALNVEFSEGNGKNAGVPNSESTRGTGEGTTWKCAIDSDISNQQTNCDPIWIGGDFVPTTSIGQIHTSSQTGPVEWDVTADVWNGNSAWLLKKTEEGQNGIVEYYSREGAADEGNMDLAPTLTIE